MYLLELKVDLEIRLILKGKQCNTEYVERILLDLNASNIEELKV